MNNNHISEAEFQREIKHYATKEDLARVEAGLVKWMVGIAISTLVVVSALAMAFLPLPFLRTSAQPARHTSYVVSAPVGNQQKWHTLRSERSGIG